ncbi:MAG: aminopeptidase [Clostridia bacterium]|nr:aminopeptidase [Clostridia bacterium]
MAENMEKTTAQLLKEQLFHKTKNTYDELEDAVIDAAYDYAEGYKKYLDAGKTERECVKTSIAMLEADGFVPYSFGMPVVAGGKYYYNNRGRSLSAFVIGTESIANGVYFTASHIDSPRIDLKAHPLYEADGLGFLKTHYYGGIKKYQWTALPLALHGTVMKADGTTVDIVVGEDETDPVFYIDDLLPHLAAQQMKKPAAEVIAGEQLNILSGSRPYEKNLPEGIKLNIMKTLYDKYGITESDFISAEISAVPAFKARDIGFDRSLIGSYGHDDRVCAYPSLTALMAVKNPVHTTMAVLADKEEVGSEGNAGMQSIVYFDIIADLAKTLGVSDIVVRANSKCLSSDVNAAFDPNFPEVNERKNSCFVNNGVVITKYTGAKGKSGTNDASAEFAGYVRNLLDAAGIIWQTSELGKVDQGGGGTVAKFIAKQNVDVIDLGVPVISMHAPYEVVSKTDVYMTHKAIEAFFKA